MCCFTVLLSGDTRFDFFFFQVKKKSNKKKGVGGDGRRQVTNIRDAPYSLKDGDVVAVVDKEEDPEGQADLTRAEDEVRCKVNEV